jgi:TonB family protein
MSLRAIIGGCGVLFVAHSTLYPSEAFLTQGQPTSAIDAKGIRHSAPSETAAPWLNDRIKAIAPEYSYADRAQRHVGTGQFHLVLDLNTGVVTRITVIKSTGFPTLDTSAVAALRQWRWKPGRWKEIDLPVAFILRQTYAPPPGSVPLPSR